MTNTFVAVLMGSGTVAAHTLRPVIGVPMGSRPLSGFDSMLPTLRPRYLQLVTMFYLHVFYRIGKQWHNKSSLKMPRFKPNLSPPDAILALLRHA